MDSEWRHPDEPEWVERFERRLRAYVDEAVRAILAAIQSPPGSPAVGVSVSVRGGQPMPGQSDNPG